MSYPKIGIVLGQFNCLLGLSIPCHGDSLIDRLGGSGALFLRILNTKKLFFMDLGSVSPK